MFAKDAESGMEHICAMRNQWLQDRISELPDKSQHGLAEKVGIGDDKVSKMIAGKRQPAPQELAPIAEYLEMSLGEVVSRFSAPDRPPSVVTADEMAAGMLSLFEKHLKIGIGDEPASNLIADARELLAQWSCGTRKK